MTQLNIEPDNDPPKSKFKDKKQKKINYKFLDGLRGFGALAVYLNHFMDMFYPYWFKKDYDSGAVFEGDNTAPPWMRYTPMRIFYQGYFWVVVFFILSGFVLPMNYFKT